MAERLPTMYGRYYTISAVWRGSQFTVNVFRPKLQLLQRSGAQRIVDKIYPGSRVISYWESDSTDAPVFLVKEEVTRTMKTFKQFREHCGLKYDVVAHQCGHCNATGYHADGEKCSTCDGRGTLQTVNDGTEMKEDYEYDMARNELMTAARAIERMLKHLQGEGELEAWVQSKITKGADYFDTVADYMDSEGLSEQADQFRTFVEDWQKVNRKDKTDGLSQKAVNAYRRENPGSKLQTAVTEKKPKGKRAARRKSFCSRMKGMKKRLTSAKTARDPDSRINKALRRWNCR